MNCVATLNVELKIDSASQKADLGVVCLEHLRDFLAMKLWEVKGVGVTDDMTNEDCASLTERMSVMTNDRTAQPWSKLPYNILIRIELYLPLRQEEVVVLQEAIAQKLGPYISGTFCSGSLSLCVMVVPMPKTLPLVVSYQADSQGKPDTPYGLDGRFDFLFQETRQPATA